MGAVVIYAMFAVVDTTRAVFATITGTARWTDVASTVGIVAVPVALLMIAGEFDLSSGVMVGSSGLLCGVLTTEYGMSMWPAILVTFAFAACIGLINGWLVMLDRAAVVHRDAGDVLLATRHQPRCDQVDHRHGPRGGRRPGRRVRLGARRSSPRTFWNPYDYQIAVVWWIGITLVATIVLTKTRFGNWIYAVGGDANAARNTGVPVRRTKITLFVATQLAAALVGIISLSRLHSMQAGTGRR